MSQLTRCQPGWVRLPSYSGPTKTLHFSGYNVTQSSKKVAGRFSAVDPAADSICMSSCSPCLETSSSSWCRAGRSDPTGAGRSAAPETQKHALGPRWKPKTGQKMAIEQLDVSEAHVETFMRRSPDTKYLSCSKRSVLNGHYSGA